MDWFKKHVDTVVVMGGLISSVLWMNGKFNDIDKRFNEVDQRMAVMEKEIAVLKTVLIMKNIMPNELAHNHENVPR